MVKIHNAISCHLNNSINIIFNNFCIYIMDKSYLKSVIVQFEYNKLLGDKTFSQLTEQELFWQYNEASNSIGVIVKHLWGNMLSRWTDFLTSDGEKTWRQREAEFEGDSVVLLFRNGPPHRS